MAYNELEQRGSVDFPVAFFYIDDTHPRYNMRAHWHLEIELIRILDGNFEITLNNKTYTAKKGDVIFINPETVHLGTPKECTYECIVFHANFLYNENDTCRLFIENIINGNYHVTELHQSHECDFVKYANELFEAFISKTPGYKFRVISCFYKLFGEIADSHLPSFYLLSHTLYKSALLR